MTELKGMMVWTERRHEDNSYGRNILAASRSPVAHAGLAHDYPNRPIHVLTTSSAGGISDIFMRVLGEEMHKSLGQPLIIENRPGGAGNIGARACQDAQPDGYTICIINADPLIYNQYLFKTLPFDPEKITPIINLFHLIQVLVINSDLKAKTVDELVAVSKAKPGTLSYLTASIPLRRLHGQPEERQRRRLGARAVQGRRRGDQRHPRRLDADRADRSRQRDLADPGRQDDGAGAGQQHPHAAAAERADAGRSRLQRRAVADLVRPVCAGRHAEGDHRQDRGRGVRMVSDPGFRDKYIISRGQVPAINTPEEFAAEIKADRAAAKEVVKEAGWSRCSIDKSHGR